MQKDDEQPVAGHVFVMGRCMCGALWTDIRDVDGRFVGKTGIAHVGGLLETELHQIRDKAEKERRSVATVMGW